MARQKRSLAVIARSLLLVGLCLMQAETVDAKQRLEVTYMKSSPDSIDWTGMGEANGEPVGIEAFWPLEGRRETGHVTHVSDFLFCIFELDNAEEPLSVVVIDMDGIINGSNNKIVFNGEVIFSDNAAVPEGTKAQLRAEVVDTAPFTTMGSVILTVP